MRYNYSDIALSKDGDILIDNTGDMIIIDNEQLYTQNIIRILNEYKGENIDRYGFGNTINELIGESNTEETGNKIREKLIADMLRSGLPIDDVIIDVYPASNTDIVIDITAQVESDIINIPANFNTNTGQITVQ